MYLYKYAHCIEQTSLGPELFSKAVITTGLINNFRYRYTNLLQFITLLLLITADLCRIVVISVKSRHVIRV